MGVVLLEYNDIKKSHYPYKLFIEAISEENVDIVSYEVRSQLSPIKAIYRVIFNILRLRSHAFYKEKIGVVKHLVCFPSFTQRKKARLYTSQFMADLHSLEYIENYQIKGILVGDLLYDSYLKNYELPTIDWSADEFRHHCYRFFTYFVYWEDFFKVNDVEAIICSHCVYERAIPIRFALSKEIKSFQVNLTHIYKLSNTNMFAYREFKFLAEIVHHLSQEEKQELIDDAVQRLNLRFSGVVGVDMGYSTKSAFVKCPIESACLWKEKINPDFPTVLIAAHCFFDSPHSYGNNLFPDFVKWIEFLGSVAKITKYNWIVKTHPDVKESSRELMRQYCDDYGFILLDRSVSHLDILDFGIDCALTVYGTVGLEYAALGKYVINASPNNPHSGFGFNFNPCSRSEYFELLCNVGSLDLFINSEEVYLYYGVKHIYFSQNIFLHSNKPLENAHDDSVYRLFEAEFNEDFFSNNLMPLIKRFAESSDFRFQVPKYVFK
jgi:hypothetical protein